MVTYIHEKMAHIIQGGSDLPSMMPLSELVDADLTESVEIEIVPEAHYYRAPYDDTYQGPFPTREACVADLERRRIDPETGFYLDPPLDPIY